MRRLAKTIAAVVGAAVGVVIIDQVIESVLMMRAFRTGDPRAMRLLMSYHKHVTNPVMVRFFSGRSKHSALLRHVGRRSGNAYATPLTAHRSEDTIIVPLPYGADTDWLRNVEAAGQCVVELEGRSFDVDEPEVVSIDEVMPLFPPFVVRIVRLHETEIALRLHVAGSGKRPST